ncbi:unnamed protein product [Symbiodinium microadriaticum]|nr:unnamed protein product [Symbiodinium microadriaticum]
MPEISAPPSSSSVCPPPQLPDGISSDPEKEWRARDKKEEPTPPQEPEGEEFVEVTVEVEPTPAKAKSGKGKSEKGAQGAKGHVKGSIGKQNVGKVKGKEPKAARVGIGKADVNAPTVKRQPKPPPTKAAPKGRVSGSAPSAPSAPSKPAGPGPAKAGGVSLVPGRRSRWVKKIHLKPRADAMRSNPPLGRRWTAHPRRRRGTKPKPTTQDRSTQTMGHSERHQKLEAEARSFAQILERHNSPNQYEARFPQVDLSIAAGRAEVTTRAVVVITDKTSYTSPMPTHRQRPPPPPPPTGATGGQGGTAAPGSPSSFSMVTGPDAPRTPDAATAALETPAPKTPAPTTPPGGAAPPGPSTPPRTTLSSSKKARVSEESGDRARGSQDPAPMDVATGPGEPVEKPIAPPSPPPTRLAGRNMAKAGAAAKAKTSFLRSHRLPPAVSWHDL